MFTGLVEELGTVSRLEGGREGTDLYVRAEKVFSDVSIGDSIAVEGVCLTLTSLENGVGSFGVAPETLRRTSLGSLTEGAKVNLERAVLPTTRLGGHYVQGHVDDIGTLKEMRPDGEALWLTIKAPRALLRYIVEKAYVAIDGASLTVTEVGPDHFSIMLIPHTQQHITLPHKKPGDAVNLEVDIMAKFAEKILMERSS
jgi:riboflavin synthase